MFVAQDSRRSRLAIRRLYPSALAILLTLPLAAYAQDSDSGDSKTGNVIKAADVGVKVVGGLAKWADDQSDDCAAAGAVGVSGCECGFEREECKDTGWSSASTDECDGSDPEISNSCGHATAHAYASEALAGSWAGRKTVVTVHASAVPVECGSNAAYAWGSASVDGTVHTKENGTATSGGPRAVLLPAGARWNEPLVSRGRATAWADGTILAVIDFEDFTMEVGASLAKPDEFEGALSINGTQLWGGFASLDASGTLTVAGDFDAADFDVTYDASRDIWIATYLPTSIEIPIGRQGAAEQQFAFSYGVTSTTDPAYENQGLTEYRPHTNCCPKEIEPHGHGEYGNSFAPAPAVFDYAAFPNPFRDATDLHFSLERETRVRLDVYDVMGRLVRSVLDAHLSAGTHSATWDGNASSGEPVEAGVYYALLTVEEATHRTRVVRIR